MALKLSDLVKKSVEKGYGSINNIYEKPWSHGSISIKHVKLADTEQPSDKPTHGKAESSNNVVTKYQQSDNESSNNVPTKYQQSDNESSNNVVTKYQQSDNESSNNVPTKYQQSDNESSNNVVTKTPQDNEIASRKKDQTYQNLQTLSGIQLVIFNKVLDLKNKTNKEYSAQINTTRLALDLGMSVNILRVSLARIVNKNLLLREHGYMGRNGSCNFKITSTILKFKEEIDQIKKISSELDIYNNNIITITTVNEGSKKTLSTNQSDQSSLDKQWWDKLNIFPVEEYGFKHTQFKQLDGLTSFEIVQESINHFGWGLKNNTKNAKYKENPSRILLSILKKGSAWIEDGYRDPQELAMEEILASKKRIADRKKKLEEEIYSEELNGWIESLTPEEIEVIAPRKKTGNLTPQRVVLSTYYTQKIIPSRVIDRQPA